MRFLALTLGVATLLPAQVVAPNSLGISMGHIHIVTGDLAGHRKLWRDLMGGQLRKIGPLEFYMFPGVLVGLREGPSVGGTDGSVINHLGFLTPDLDRTKAALEAAGVPIVKEMPLTRQLFSMFPDNVKVEFSEDKTIQAPYVHHHVHFASHEVEPMRAWYARTFDAIPGKRLKFQAADLPGVNLSWNPADSPQLASKGRAVDHIGFEVRDLKAFCERLKASGLTLDMPLTVREDLNGLKIAFLTDPWGTRIELTEGLIAIR